MPYHNYFCNVISNKFPRLLAEREIIANALFLPTMSDEPNLPTGLIAMAKVQKYIAIVKLSTDFLK